MTRHGATPRRQWPQWQLPDIWLPQVPWRPVLAGLAIVLAILAAFRIAPVVLNQPVSWEYRGQWLHLEQQAVEKAMAPWADDGFWETDLVALRRGIESLPWVDQASVSRQWPDRMVISITEQVPLAVWNGNGLINHRGQVFRPDNASVSSLGPRLPELNAPEGRAEEVMNHYLRFSQIFHPVSDRMSVLTLADRGAWSLRFESGIEVHLGQQNILQRARRTARVLETVGATGEYVRLRAIDARYQHAVAVAWKSGESA